LLDYKIRILEDNLKQDDLKFLELSGRKGFYSQSIFGQGIIVAILDTGINADHPELKGRVLKGKNFCSYRSSNNTEDDNGHGTHVAATVAGKNVGIAPRAEVLPVKVVDENGGGSWTDEILRGLDWVLEYRSSDGRKVSIVNMSLGGKDINEKEKKLLGEAIKRLVDNNIAVIVASGNSGEEELYYPGAYNEVICVGAVDINRERAMFSTIGNQVDVCQVGVDVLSAWYKGGYSTLSGTSMATPIVSGIGALIACKHKLLFGEDIQEDYLWKNLKMNTKDMGIAGVDKIFGAGFCTLQPLEANIVISHNSRKSIVNGNEVSMDRVIRIRENSFELPSHFISEATGCLIEVNTDKKQAKVIY